MRTDGQWRMGLLLAVGMLLLPLSAVADIYKWVDPQGQLHFTDTPTHPGYRLYMKVRRSAAPSRTTVAPDELAKLFRQYAERFRLEEPLLKAIAKTESNFNPAAVSKRGAQGLMQLMPDTAEEMGVSNPFDPAQSLYGGSRYLRQQLDRFSDLDLALAAYNAGPSMVVKYGGIPPFDETREYIRRVRSNLDYFRVRNGERHAANR